MEMSNALQKNLMQLFPNKIIYSAELCKNISVHMALHREAKRADRTLCGFEHQKSRTS